MPASATELNGKRLLNKGKEMKKLIAILLLAFTLGCLPSYHRPCSELEADPSVSLGEFYRHCRGHSQWAD